MENAAELSPIEELMDLIGSYTHDPAGYVDMAYDWGEGELEGMDGPRTWQSETLEEIGEHLRNEETRHQPLMLSVASGHGPGKSALVGMICDWGLNTCEDTRIVVTANTDTQLKTRTQPEVSKWFKRSIAALWWKVTATRISSTIEGHDIAWRCDFSPWSEHNTEAFAGLHNKKKRIILIFDEASAIADGVWEVAEGALTDEDTEIIWIAFGNPTRVSGRFRECFRKYKHRWIHRQIDTRTVEGINLKKIKQWEEDYGEDSDFFKVRVRGQFPSAGDKQFIDTKLVDDAQARGKTEFEYDLRKPLVIGIDFARSGKDKSVIRARRGRHTYPPIKFRERNSMKAAVIIVDKLSQAKRLWHSEPDAIFADGGSIGGPIIDRLHDMNVEDLFEIQFGSSADDKEQWGNKRIEMWAGYRDWLETGYIDDDQDLYDDSIAPELLMMKKRDVYVLESKEDMALRGIPSTDDGDALALTFARKVMKKVRKKVAGIEVVDDGIGY